MLSILSYAEIIEHCCSLLWAFSVSNWEHPVLQGIIAISSLSLLQWMQDCYLQYVILLNEDHTPQTIS